MIDGRFVLIAAALSMSSSIAYAVLTVRGTVRPNRVTWLFWGVAPMIAFLAQWYDDVGWSAVSTLAVSVGPLIVFAATFTHRGSPWRLTSFDLACGITSGLAIVGWVVTNNPAVAVALAILADLAGGVPTIVKAWRHPLTERPFVYRISASNGGIALLTVQHWHFVAYGFPLFLLCLGVGLTAVVTLRSRAILRRGPGPDASSLGDP